MEDSAQNLLAPAEPTAATVDRDSILASMRISLDTLAAVATPEDYKFPFPQYYHLLFQQLTSIAPVERDFSQFAIGLPRGFAKTSFLKLLVVWLIWFSRKRFILIVLATERMAENFLADVADILSSDNAMSLFGNWKLNCPKNTNTDKEFEFGGRSVKLTAMGAGSSLRGIVRNNRRPDIQLMDDIQTAEDAESPILSDKLFKWMLGTLIYTRSPFGCQHIFVGNMYPTEDCILKKLRDSRNWLSFITGAILQDGTSLWEDLHPIELLYAELSSLQELGKANIFMSEKMNDPSIQPKTGFDSTKVRTFQSGGLLHSGNFILIDPSGSKKKSDDTAIGYFEIYDANKPHLAELIKEKLTPKQTILKALSLCRRHRCFNIVVEDVAYQATLLYWFAEVLNQLQITGITLHPINPKGVPKTSRILSSFKQLQSKEITLETNLASEVYNLIYKYDPRSTNNVDDVLDIIAYAPRVVTELSYAIALPDESQQDEQDELGVMSELETSAI